MEKNKKLLIAFFLLIIIIVIIWFFISQPKKPVSDGKISNNSTDIVTSSPVQESKDNYSTEEEKVVLNFKDTQVVIKGYPLISKDYVKIFNFVYLGMGGDEDAFIQQEVSVDQQGSYSYKLSSDQNRIFAGVGKDGEGKAIKQTMEIIPLDNFSNMTQDCQTADENINGLSAKTINCPDFSLPACWIPVDEKSAIFYKQESGNKIPGDNMCDNLRKNGIRSITFQPY